MTDQRINLPDLGDLENDTLTRLLRVIDSKAKFNRRMDAQYDAERNVRATFSGVVPPQYYNLGLVLGWSAKAVDALARRCYLEGMDWGDGDLGSIGLQELWDDNRIGAESVQGITSGLIHAVAFVVASQGALGEPKSLIHFYDASDATGDWNTRTRRLDNLLVVHSRDQDNKADAVTAHFPGVTVTGVRENGRWKSDVSQH